MLLFTVRFELHNAQSEDYDRLHEEMEKFHFKKTIKSNNGKIYELPTAEYNIIIDEKPEKILDNAYQAAINTGKSASVLVTPSAGRYWINLPEV
ncbi:type V toxin-antitoxin system endoribonuclease antitoxin GhoS [Gluconobacter japonicus]|uniref:type V toxin-antitoxin system endoribonuclease antitoxin GhoS n=1 Tax=Gluconobacter japonicus TaxID=376620 RepID=UPI000AE2AAEC|nr:type V toxin-antitoxin system endoribonuclease antitoxin GhoS [Gluconobacter japonicus]